MSKQRGLLVKDYIGAGLLNRGERISATFEVERIEETVTKTKVKVLNVTGVKKTLQKQLKAEVDGDWILTKDIEWLES